mmetsp:Transcript_6906/g.9671  ORF Transcript_6906/g.9671 Transcript_6906/m.9671 type:complete len:254 (-) Transcript_6906:123-884(-)
MLLLLENGSSSQDVVRHGPSHVLEWRSANYELIDWKASAKCHVETEDLDRVAKTYYFSNADTTEIKVKIYELAPTVDTTTGLGVWDAAIALAMIILIRKPKVAKVIELGCGLALPLKTLTEIRGSSDGLLATDASQSLIHAIDFPNVCRLDWGEDDQELDSFDLMLGAEIIYVAHSVPKLCRLIRRLSPNQIWLTALARRRPLLAALTKALRHDYQATFHELTLAATSPDPVTRITVDNQNSVDLIFLDLQRS